MNDLMEALTSSATPTPVRTNLAEMLLKLKDVPAEVRFCFKLLSCFRIHLSNKRTYIILDCSGISK